LCFADNQTSFFGGEPVLSQAWGYVIVVGFGIFFSIFTTWYEDCLSLGNSPCNLITVLLDILAVHKHPQLLMPSRAV
jgi:hypothetical protein